LDTNGLSIERCLAEFTSPEALSDPLVCSQCQQRTLSQKRLRINKLPQVLLLHLKRFDSNRQHKMRLPVAFPLRGLSLDPFLSGAHDVSTAYNLVGVVVHQGADLNQGHYCCFASRAGRWVRYDDDVADDCSEVEVLAAEAYMLMYFRA
jgi:ubiquitin C-terminal hydrolase